MYVVLFGPPGAGKGTQAMRIAQAERLAHVATGDMFRDNIRARTTLGQRVESYLTKGELVPDQLTIGLLMDRLDQPDAAAGAVLDGFPRTISQAQALDRALHARGKGVGVAVLIEVADAEGQWRTARLLSHGTAEQLYLLLRLALARHLTEPSGESCPLILDDVVSAADTQRKRELLETLLSVSESTQVILFTHEEDVRAWAEERLTGAQDRLTVLAGEAPGVQV